MNLTVVSPPPFEPVTLAQVWTHLRLDPAGSPLSHDDDEMLLGFIQTAREQVEAATRRSLIQQTLRLSCGGFPTCHWPGGRAVVTEIRLLRPPLIRVESVRYYDAENALQEVDPADYYVTDDLVPELRFTTGYAAPSVYDRPDALRIDYVAGYPTASSPTEGQADYAANVPQAMKDACLLGVQLLYDNLPPAEREAVEKMRAALLRPLTILLTP